MMKSRFTTAVWLIAAVAFAHTATADSPRQFKYSKTLEKERPQLNEETRLNRCRPDFPMIALMYCIKIVSIC